MEDAEKPTVTIIGTCRVHDTLRQVEKQGLIRVNNGGLSTYVHSLPEIFLRLKVFNRERKYSQDIMDLQIDTRSGTGKEPIEGFSIDETDIVVIEISSLKTISYRNHPLQYNEVNRLLCTPHGDFGIDLIVDPKNKGAILTVIDRLSRYCIIEKLSSKGSKEVKHAVIEIFKNYNGKRYSITSDNGNEFMLHEVIAQDVNIDYYFAHPYASYQRGSIENLNGLIRQYIPKGKSFDDINQTYVKKIERKLNTRPRKVLKFLTPNEFSEK